MTELDMSNIPANPEQCAAKEGMPEAAQPPESPSGAESVTTCLTETPAPSPDATVPMMTPDAELTDA